MNRITQVLCVEERKIVIVTNKWTKTAFFSIKMSRPMLRAQVLSSMFNWISVYLQCLRPKCRYDNHWLRCSYIDMRLCTKCNQFAVHSRYKTSIMNSRCLLLMLHLLRKIIKIHVNFFVLNFGWFENLPTKLRHWSIATTKTKCTIFAIAVCLYLKWKNR